MVIASEKDTEIMLLPVLIPPSVARLLGEIAEKQNTTIGALITNSLREIVKKELGEDGLAEIEREL